MPHTAAVGAPVGDRDSAPWWEALTRHELLLQRCSTCETLRWPARALCGTCGSFSWEWTPSVGSATVATWNVVWSYPASSADVPYVVVVARTDDQADILMPGCYAGPQDGSDLRVGMPVRIGFVDVEQGDDPPLTILQWIPDRQGEL